MMIAHHEEELKNTRFRMSPNCYVHNTGLNRAQVDDDKIRNPLARDLMVILGVDPMGKDGPANYCGSGVTYRASKLDLPIIVVSTLFSKLSLKIILGCPCGNFTGIK